MASKTTPASDAVGLSFIENSDLSVCEKIKLYFAKQQPTYQVLNSSCTSTSSSSTEPDFDASFQQILEQSKLRRELINTTRNQAISSGPQIMDETTIDLCSSPESVGGMSSPRVEASPNLSAFNGTLFGEKDSRVRAPSTHRNEPNAEDSDESLGVAELDDTLPQEDILWCLEQSASDLSFLEHERQCAEEAAREKAEKIEEAARKNAEKLVEKSMDDTLLFDTEAPSMLWDQTISGETLNLFSMQLPNTVFRSRPSTIPEESTINSSSNSSPSVSLELNTNSILKKNMSVNRSINSSSATQATNTISVKKIDKPSTNSARGLPTALETKTNSVQEDIKVKGRRSSINIFPKRKFRPLLSETCSSAPTANKPVALTPRPKVSSSSTSNPITKASPIVKPIATKPFQSALQPNLIKPKWGSPMPKATAPKSIGHLPRTSPAKPQVIKPTKKQNSPAVSSSINLSPHRKSFSLMSFDDSVVLKENSFDSDSDSPNHQFNDTIEAMDFYMNEGKKLNKESTTTTSFMKTPPSSKQKTNSTPSPGTASNRSPSLMHFSPRNTNRTPDTIRRQILMRNLVRNSVAIDQSGDLSTGYQFSEEEMRVRRSVRPIDDSF